MQLVCYVSLFQRKVQTTEKYKKKYTKTANYVYKQNINIYYVVLAINLDMDSAWSMQNYKVQMHNMYPITVSNNTIVQIQHIMWKHFF